MTFFPPFFRSDFGSPKMWTMFAQGPKKRPNAPPNDPKSVPKAPQNRYLRISEKCQKPLFLLWFGHMGPSSFERFGDQNGDRRADRPTDTPKQRKCRQVVPKVTQMAPERSPFGRYLDDPVRTKSLGRTMGPYPGRPWAPRGDPEVHFFTIVDRFGTIWKRFSTCFHQNLLSFHR